ncbi:PREDICTED: pentatricopeptide repeat-containing [Prunus dulcis]|uniref:PREDICTED: pentatricopeptide repeat-containing n=1 Tax=Prunus dulcis TaxID=3755 RepID=A0A5E4EHS9_PRUDU|nr:PREDICTED: pentatricopeptide repeat-containing [Prunus dulcis]
MFHAKLPSQPLPNDVFQASKAKAILALLQGCNSLIRLKKIHAYVITNGLQHQTAISNKLLNFCAVSVSGCLAYAQLLFHHHIQNPQTQDWNSMIRGFSQSPSPLQAIFYYNHMLSSASDSCPDTFTFSFVLKACEKVKAQTKCKEVHGAVVRYGYENDVVLRVVVHQAALHGYVQEGSLITVSEFNSTDTDCLETSIYMVLENMIVEFWRWRPSNHGELVAVMNLFQTVTDDRKAIVGSDLQKRTKSEKDKIEHG